MSHNRIFPSSHAEVADLPLPERQALAAQMKDSDIRTRRILEVFQISAPTLMRWLSAHEERQKEMAATGAETSPRPEVETLIPTGGQDTRPVGGEAEPIGA